MNYRIDITQRDIYYACTSCMKKYIMYQYGILKAVEDRTYCNISSLWILFDRKCIFIFINILIINLFLKKKSSGEFYLDMKYYILYENSEYSFKNKFSDLNKCFCRSQNIAGGSQLAWSTTGKEFLWVNMLCVLWPSIRFRYSQRKSRYYALSFRK